MRASAELKTAGRNMLAMAMVAAGLAAAAWPAHAAEPVPLVLEQVQESARVYARTLADSVPSPDEKSCGTTYMSVCIPSFCSIFSSQPDMAEACVHAAAEQLETAMVQHRTNGADVPPIAAMRHSTSFVH